PNKGPGYNPPNKGPGHNPPNKGPGHNPPNKGPGYNPPNKGPGHNPPNKGPGHNPTSKRPGYRPNSNRPSITVINNITLILYNVTFNGFVIGGNTQWRFISNCTLDPGDVIVSVGGINCGNSNLSLQQLINIAYQNGNFSVVIRDVNTGNLETFQLDPPDDGNQ